MALKGLSDSDVAILQSLIDVEKRRNPGYRGKRTVERTHAESEDHQAPEVYVAKTPSGGIDALETCTTGTGTPGCMSTGTGIGDGYDEPGFAGCNLYVVDLLQTTPDLRLIGKDVEVWNVLSSGVAGDAYVPVARDKFGRWLVIGGGGGNALIRFEVLAAGPLLGTGIDECDYVTAKVMSISCQGAGVSIDDEVTIWDPGSCQFNIPIEVLIGTQGWALKVVNYTEGVVDCVDEVLAAGACRWEVQTLCCGEEIYGG